MYVIALLPVIVYLAIKNNKGLVAFSPRKYRSIIVIAFGITMLYFFNSNHIEIANIVIPLVFIIIGCCYLSQDYTANRAKKK